MSRKVGTFVLARKHKDMEGGGEGTVSPVYFRSVPEG